ncbi:MAG: SDR family NAD(P)-dependent oxidoreductase [Acidimicrobiia bacterium]
MKVEKGQVAVVTGAASGIGLGMAKAFAGRGLDVVISDIRADQLDAAVKELESLGGGRVKGVVVDVRDEAQVENLAATTIDTFGRVDIACNNAGVVGPLNPMWEVDMTVWRWMLDVMLFGVVHGIRAFMPRLLAQGSGHIVNTASAGGLVPIPQMGPYSAAKHAVVGLTETLAAEVASTGIDVGVSVLCPGIVATQLGESSTANRPSHLVIKEEKPRVIGGGLDPATFMQPDEVGPIVVAGIEARKLHILTHADMNGGVKARVDALLADLL